MERYYENCTWADIEALDKANTLVLIPVGATEQHGPHLPLGTDSINVQRLAEGIGETLPPECPLLIFPLLPVGLSVEHMHFPGSITLQPETLLRVCTDVCNSLARHGFRRLVFLNGHGGNSATLANVAYQARAEHGVGVFIIDVSTLLARPDKPVQVGTEPGCDGHAGELETALTLYSRPHTVHLERAVPTRPERFLNNRVFTLEGPVSVGWLANDLSCYGSCGNPTLATAEQGKAMMTYMIDTACAALQEILVWPLDVQRLSDT